MLFHDYASWTAASLRSAGWDGTARGLGPDRHASSERESPILRNYIVYTFRRAHHQGRVTEVVDDDGRRYATFNTGLLTPHFERIFGFFVEQTRSEIPQPWFLQDFLRESDHRLLRVPKISAVASEPF